MKRRALFFKTGSFSLVNEQLAAELPGHLPEYDLEWLDIVDIARRNPLVYFAATVETILRHGRRIISRRLPPKTFLSRSSIFIGFLRKWIERNVDPSKVAFTFQTQSLFNAGRTGVPHFEYTDHTYFANRRYPRPKSALPSSRLWQQIENDLYRGVAVNFTTSEFAARSLMEDYAIPADRVECVFSGINLKFPEAFDGGNRKGNKIIFIGVDWERKGGPELLAAFKPLKASFPSAELHIIGCSPGIDLPGVHVHGRVPSEQVVPHLLACDIFCMPSRAEPSAAALVEASAYGLPVVTTRVGGSGERVIEGETGFLVEAGDVPSLTVALHTLLARPELCRQMGTNGRAFTKDRFTWPAVAEKIAARIRKTLRDA
jgi:glycosyltransferase involved in cell wall biosynthesis